MPHSSRYDKDERDFLAETLCRDVFSAFDAARQVRQSEVNFDRAKLCDRLNKDKTGVSKLLRGPGNWTLRTIATYANALDLDVVLTLVDRTIDGRRFIPLGVAFSYQDSISKFGVLSEPKNTAIAAPNQPRSLGPGLGHQNTTLFEGPVHQHGSNIVY